MIAKPVNIGSDHILYLSNIRDRNNNLISDGEVTYVWRSKYKVDGAFQTIDSGTLAFVSAGRHEKVIDADITSTLVEGRHYYVTMTFVDPDGEDLVKRIELYATYA